MLAKNRPIHAILSIVFAAASIVVIGCGSSTNPPANDAGATADASLDADASVADTGSDVSSAADADAAAPLTISPTAPTAKGCSTDTVTFTASGGTPPYTWSTSEGGSTNLTVIPTTQATWTDSSDNFCGTPGTVTITVTDSKGATASAVITVLAG